MPTDRWGIDDGWIDTADEHHAVPERTIAEARAAMGEPEGRDVVVVRPGGPRELAVPSAIVLEDGSDAGEHRSVPQDLPPGIHEVHPADGARPSWVIVSPGRCHLPADLRTWGVTMQVPTTRSRGSWGIGDLADVRTLATWIAARGGGALGLSPLHAATPVSPLPPSPYSPSSRRWRNPLLLRVDALPGADADTVVQDEAALARALLAERHVDRDRVWVHQHAALARLWATRSPAEEARLRAWQADQGAALEGWARFCALAEVHGPEWPAWPTELRRPDGIAVDRAVAPLADRVAFHAWLQLLVDDQLHAAAVPGVRIVQDLAIGVDPYGADAWLHQDLLALEVSIGAPPDDFAPDGQVWGLPPYIPWRLRDAGYRPLAELLRAAMADDGGLRIDHVMGLSRLFWVPADTDPSDGAYVRFAGRELLDVLALESARAGAVVVGEDLGTVEPHFRAELTATQVLSTRVAWFEDEPPERYPRASLAMLTTHDLPTTVGVWTGADDDELLALGRPAPAAANAELHHRLDALVALDEDAPLEAVLEQAHRRLGAAGSALVLATMEDLTAVEARPNVPGTTTERTNWSTALPISLDDLSEDGLAMHLAAALAEGRGPAVRGD